MLHKNSLVLS